MSHPVWVRGLKPNEYTFNRLVGSVAPRVGAWIETLGGAEAGLPSKGRTPCGCVD